mmetsp:Transcript_2923/g.11799  ORF Transcript_2923/g.11799 Transcript_2923/m.11799 type:complete len:242 (+) Transcript_2923:617-1342(+)
MPPCIGLTSALDVVCAWRLVREEGLDRRDLGGFHGMLALAIKLEDNIVREGSLAAVPSPAVERLADYQRPALAVRCGGHVQDEPAAICGPDESVFKVVVSPVLAQRAGNSSFVRFRQPPPPVCLVDDYGHERRRSPRLCRLGLDRGPARGDPSVIKECLVAINIDDRIASSSAKHIFEVRRGERSACCLGLGHDALAVLDGDLGIGAPGAPCARVLDHRLLEYAKKVVHEDVREQSRAVGR